MGSCGCGHGAGAGPYAEGRELVDFVARAHGGSLRERAVPGGGLSTSCQGCAAPFVMTTFVALCPACGGVHAVSPPRCDDAANIQYAGEGYTLPAL
ncbi:hypothetical protein LPW11_18065 [Geomonas sp. RF6]|uniref:hypothetical protein n=1 Tax=Geomonas sp. RF6 TaxID=2897342 RepID=UPI001E485950|nr:hypothetical protein [Geomonas sp. RF6]UFS69784.1 hypothetical protein LPW11_18065 [Geomonas sp. RF6]